MLEHARLVISAPVRLRRPGGVAPPRRHTHCPRSHAHCARCHAHGRPRGHAKAWCHSRARAAHSARRRSRRLIRCACCIGVVHFVGRCSWRHRGRERGAGCHGRVRMRPLVRVVYTCAATHCTRTPASRSHLKCVRSTSYRQTYHQLPWIEILSTELPPDAHARPRVSNESVMIGAPGMRRHDHGGKGTWEQVVRSFVPLRPCFLASYLRQTRSTSGERSVHWGVSHRGAFPSQNWGCRQGCAIRGGCGSAWAAAGARQGLSDTQGAAGLGRAAQGCLRSRTTGPA